MSVAVLPYAPGSAPVAPGAGTFYRIDHRRFTVGEYRRWTKSPLSILRSKWLGATVRTSSDDPAVVSLAPFEIPAAAVLPEIRAKFDPHLGPLMAAGFHSPVFHFIDDVLHSTRIYTATLVDPSGRGVAKIQNRLWSVRKPPKDITVPVFLTGTHDRRFVMTSGAEADLNAPPSVDTRHVPGAALAVVRAEHERRLTEPGRTAVISVASADDARALLERHHAMTRDFHVARGVFKPLTDADVRRLATLQRHQQLARAGALQYPEVLAEIDRLQNRKAGWVGMVLIFALSLAAFLLLGAKGSLAGSWPTLALIVGVLFIHEMGHYVAMQVFGYKNVRMFFIPGFGAAVSGRHYNVPGWRKAVVSLMGPVPGIFLGIAVGLLGVALHQPMLVKASLVAIGLNASNLLPVLPLDGGWVMHTLFFSRHYLLDGLFRAAAGVGIILICLALHLKYLMYVGIALLVSLPLSFKLARIASELQAEGISPISPDDQTIPPDTAERIIAKVKAAFTGRATTNNVVAQHTLKVFELINARPPGVGATIGLSALHGGSFVLALIFGLLIFVANNPQSFRQQWALAQARARARTAAVAPPKYALNPDAIRTPNHAPRGATTRKAVVGTFGGEAEARQVYAAATEGDAAEASLLGRTVAVSFPATDEAARRRWLTDFKGHAGSTVFVTGGDRRSFGGPGIRLTCTAPDEQTAKQIESDVEDYFGCTHVVHAVPPWHPEFGPTPGARARLRIARHTFKRLNEAGYRFGEAPDAALKALNDRARRAANEGDTAELKRIHAERAKLNDRRREQDIEKLAGDTSGEVDLVLVRLFTSVPRHSATQPAVAAAVDDEDEDLGPPGFDYKSWREAIARQCGPRLGQLPLEGSQPAPAAEAYSSPFGSAKHQGTHLTFAWFSFNDPVYGPPALVRWLAANGCTDFKYEVQTPFGEQD
jgi:Zn-dependent protease